MIVINVFAALWILARAAPTAAPVVGQHTSNSDNVPLASARYLQPRADGTIDALAFLATLTATFIKYNVGYIPSPSDVPTTSDPLISTNAQDEGTVGISVRNTIPPQSESVSILSTPRGLNLGYHGSVTVGDQGRAQTFPAEYDTGSSLLVIPGRRCGDAQSCTGRIKYDEQGVEGVSDVQGSSEICSLSLRSSMLTLTSRRATAVWTTTEAISSVGNISMTTV